MKVWTITKRHLILTLCCFVIGIATVGIIVRTAKGVVSTVSEVRDIPIYCVKTDEKKVAISFDAAWGNEQTETLLRILEEKDVKTTFFLVGEWVDKYPDSVKAISQKGHDVENHSSTHPYMTQLTEEKMAEEITSCNEKIQKLTGKCPTLFRPPYGDYNNQVVAAVKNSGMYCIQWDVDSLDWKDPSPSDMVERITSKIGCGSIILMHNGAKNTPEALPQIIDAVRALGYEFVPISELVPEGSYTTDHEGRMHTTEQ